MKGAFLSEILSEVVAVMSGTKPKLRTQVFFQNIKCCSHKSWGYDFKLHSCALQIHSSNFGSCTSYKLEKEKLKPPWLTFLQLISPQPNDKNWTILLLKFFCSSSAIWHLFQLNACCNTIFPSHLILTLMWLK